MNDELAGPERLAKWSEAFREYSRDTDPASSLSNLTRVWRELSGSAGMIAISVKDLSPGEYRVNRLLHKEGIASTSHVDTPLHAPEAAVQSGGFIGEIIASSEPKVLRDVRVSNDPVLGDALSRYHHVLAFPIFEEGEITSWLLNLHTDEEDVSGREIENRFIQATLVGNVTDEKRHMKELRKARKWIESEIDEIAQIQMNLLPETMPSTERFAWAPFYETYERAGGDYYDVFPLDANSEDNHRWGVLMADASGHGPKAAVIVAMLSALRGSYPGTLERPSALLEYLNQHLIQNSIGYSFVTAHLAFIDADTLTMTYCCAGHPPPFLKQPDNSVTALPTECSMPLGIQASTTYHDTELQLSPGQTLFLYTDGITEAHSPSGEMLDEAGLLNFFADAHGSADETLAQLVQRLRDHEAGRPPGDDQTMLVVQVIA